MLYKYLHQDRIDYLENQLVRATQPAALNDPFECLSIPPSIEEAIVLCAISHKEYLEANKIASDEKASEMLDTELKKIRDDSSSNYREYIIKSQYDRINAQIGIVSFSKCWDSPLMWAHYANTHEGFCIGFDDENDFFHTNEDSFFSGKRVTVAVEYSSDRIKIPIETKDAIQRFKETWCLMALKSKDWSYEKEVRTILTLEDYNEKIERRPYDIYLFLLPHLAVKEIIVGLYASDKLKMAIFRFATERQIPVWQVEKSPSKFTFDRRFLLGR